MAGFDQIARALTQKRQRRQMTHEKSAPGTIGEIVERGAILPIGRTEHGKRRFAVPQAAQEVVDALKLPGRALKGEPYTMGDVVNMALTLEMGSLGGSAPRGALRSGASRVSRDLPMDDASRMARARQMGFDTNQRVYHGTPDARPIHEHGFSSPAERAADFLVDKPEKGPYFFTTNPKVARSYADETRAFDLQGAKPEVIEAFLKKSNPLIVDVEGATFKGLDFDAVKRALFDKIPSGPKRDNLERFLANIQTRDGKISTDNFASLARRYGFDSAVVKNVRDTYKGAGPKSDVVMVFDPSQIRSVKAAFDPKRAKSGDILAGVAGASVAANEARKE